MFIPIKGGTKHLIPDAFGVDFECWIPPIGYGINRATGKLEKTDIIKRSKNIEEQYWEREALPEWYDDLREKEELLQEMDPEYVDEKLEEIREKHWGRRLRGVWFYNNGVATYITGLHWLMLNWWEFQGKYFDYRLPQMEQFYVIDYCIEDPDCLGDIEITKRKFGKTAVAGAFIYEYISRTASKHGGIQSKTDPDASEAFKKSIVTPWRKLPHFFRPLYDSSKGDDPDKELRFFNPSTRTTRKSKINKKQKALESFIDFKPRLEGAYDGPELHRYVSDEAGKLKDVSILKRHQIVQFCSEVDGVYVGKHHYTTTVEEMDAGGSEFYRLVKMSDRRHRNENGRTSSGLYVHFIPAYRTLYFDKYGIPDENRAKTYYMNTRAGLQNDSQALSSFVRKNPFTMEEAFRVDGEDCIYDSEKLNNQLDRLSWGDNFTTRGDLVWKGGIRDTIVEWVPNKKGVFEVTCLPDKELRNKIIKRGNLFYPNNKLHYIAGGDPYDYDKTKDDKRRSNGTGFVKWKYSSHHSNNIYNDSLIVKYSHRPQTASIYYEEMIKMCVFFGCEFLPERNKIGLIKYFENRGYGAFLVKFPGEVEAGIAAGVKTKQEMVEVTEEFIINNIHKVFFKSLIQQWLLFDINDTEKFDEAMGAGWTLLADKNRITKLDSEVPVSIGDLMPRYKINA